MRDALLIRMNAHLRTGGWLVRLGDPHEVWNLTGQGLLVLPGVVALDQLLGGAIDIDLDISGDQPAVFFSRRFVGADGGDQDCRSTAGQQVGDVAKPLNDGRSTLLGVLAPTPQPFPPPSCIPDFNPAAYP